MIKLSISEFEKKVKPWQLALFLFLLIALFASIILWRRDNHLSSPSKVRYTVCKIKDYNQSNWYYHYHGFFWYQGASYKCKYYRPGLGNKWTRPKFVLERYYWVKFNIEKPDFNEVVVGKDYTQSFADSIPVPKEGLTEDEFLKLYKSLESDSTTFRSY